MLMKPPGAWPGAVEDSFTSSSCAVSGWTALSGGRLAPPSSEATVSTTLPVADGGTTYTALAALSSTPAASCSPAPPETDFRSRTVGARGSVISNTTGWLTVKVPSLNETTAV